MKKPFQQSVRSSSNGRRAFTLIEMLIAVTVTLILMAMFAQVFKLAGDAVARQKGMAKNDQRARKLTVLLREDIAARTFKTVYPFKPGQNTEQSGPNFAVSDRQGYLYIAENNPDDPTDDVLAFTARYPTPVTGTARMLAPLLVPNASPPPNFVLANQNQPDFDDGWPPETDSAGNPILDANGNQISNQMGVSRLAEVTYYLRNGNLYRRVLLVREPYDDEGTGTAQPDEIDPPLGNGNYPQALPSPLRFWKDFDYSAYRVFPPVTPPSTPGVRFHDAAKAMENIQPATGVVPWDHDGDGGAATPVIFLPPNLGIPLLRFGSSLLNFNFATGDLFPPREFVPNAAGTGQVYIGRFLLQEVSDNDFLYPGTGNAASDPHTRTNIFFDPASELVSPYNGDVVGGVPQFPRRGEDILLTDVHEFDIKVWDDYFEADINGNGVADNEDANNNLIFDPGEDVTLPGQPGPNGLFDVEDWNRNGVVGPLDTLRRFVDLGHNHRGAGGAPIGFYNRQAFPIPLGGGPVPPNGTLASGEPGGPFGVLNPAYSGLGANRFRYDTWHPFLDTTTGVHLGWAPFRPVHLFGNDRVSGTSQDDDADGTSNNTTELGFLGSDDERPLKAIQIKIRYFDVTSNQMQDLTLVFSLDENQEIQF